MHATSPDGPPTVTPAPVEHASAADSAACLRCGVCCHSTLETYVRVTGADWERLGDEAERVAHFIGHRAYLRMQDGRCAALALQTDAASGHRLHVCTIYERRPQVCRDLARGSPACEAELLRKADHAPAATHPHPPSSPCADLPRLVPAP